MKVWFLIIFLAVSTLSCAIKQETSDKTGTWQYYYDLGMSSFLAKNYSEAIANFFKATSIAPNEPRAWNALGFAYMEVQEYRKAEESFTRALTVDGSFTEAKLNLGILYYRMGDGDKALSVIREVLKDEAFPQKHIAYYYASRVYELIGNKEEYFNNLRKAVLYNPMFVEAQLELAQAYEREGQWEEARRVYRNLTDNGMGSASIDLSLARVEYHLKDYSAAKEHIRRVMENKQTTPQLKAQAYELLSQILIKEQEALMQRRADTIQRGATPTLEGPSEAPMTRPEVLKFYRIQLGAFSSEVGARRWRENLEMNLNLRDVVVVESSGVYRVLYGRFENRGMASKELERLKSLNLYGFIVYE